MSRVRILFVNPQTGDCSTGTAAYRSLESLYQGLLGKTSAARTPVTRTWVRDVLVRPQQVGIDTPNEMRGDGHIYYYVAPYPVPAPGVVEPAPAPPVTLSRWKQALWMFEHLPKRYQEVSTLVISRDGRHQSWGRSHANPAQLGLAKPKKPKKFVMHFTSGLGEVEPGRRERKIYAAAVAGIERARRSRPNAPAPVGGTAGEIPMTPKKPTFRGGVWA